MSSTNVVRIEGGRILAALAAATGDLQLAEDAVQDATVAALEESIRLARLVVELLPGEATAEALLALLLLTDARRPARVDPDGSLVPLPEQDRARWSRASVDEGLLMLTRSLARTDGVADPYQLQAAIAACHSTASSHDTTDWTEIVRLSGILAEVHPNPVSTSTRRSPSPRSKGRRSASNGWSGLTRQCGRTSGNVGRAEMLVRLGRNEAAADAFETRSGCGTDRAGAPLHRRSALGQPLVNSEWVRGDGGRERLVERCGMVAEQAGVGGMVDHQVVLELVQHLPDGRHKRADQPHLPAGKRAQREIDAGDGGGPLGERTGADRRGVGHVPGAAPAVRRLGEPHHRFAEIADVGVGVEPVWVAHHADRLAIDQSGEEPVANGGSLDPRPTTSIEDIITEIERDPTGIFWGRLTRLPAQSPDAVINTSAATITLVLVTASCRSLTLGSFRREIAAHSSIGSWRYHAFE